MKAKHITIITLLSALIFTTPCSAEKNNPVISMIMSNWNRARTWSNNVYITCRDVGVLATIYAAFGMYDFNNITGLDEKILNTYNIDQLKNANQRITTMIQYTSPSPTGLKILNQFSTQIQGKIMQQEDAAQAATDQAKIDQSYDEKQVAREIEEMIRTQRSTLQNK